MDSVRFSQQLQSFLRKEVAELVVGFDSVARLVEVLETFVEHELFAGTAYAAANWQRIGQSTGRGQLAAHAAAPQPIRDIWVYPLDPRFRAVLTDDRRTDAASSPEGGSLR